MRLSLILAAVGMLSAGCVAHAHPAHHRGPVVEVTLGWDWVNGRWVRGQWVRGYWHHPHYGKSYRHLRQGPPPRRPHVHSAWVPGHWEGRGHRRHWVPGHWR